MSPTDLDYMLTAMAEPLPAAAETEARRLAEETMPSRLKRGGAPRARWVVPVFVGGAVALTAGAGTATIVMSHWGGVSMPIENVRNAEPIHVSWVTESGHEETCRVWIELRNPLPGDRSVLDQAIVARDWSGLGQRLYDTAESVPSDVDGESRVGDGLTPVVQALASETFPGVHWFGDGIGTTERAIDAWGMTCVPEAE